MSTKHLEFLLYSIIILSTIGCRTTPDVNTTDTLPDFPFSMDSLIHYGTIEYMDWEEEQISPADLNKNIKYYQGGVLLQSKTQLQSFDTLYYPDVTGIPKEKLSTLTRRVPSRDNQRLIPIPAQYENCDLDSNTIKRIEYCKNIYYSLTPVNPRTFTHEILSPKYEKDYPDGLPMKMEIYTHNYYDDMIAVSWEEWEKIRKKSDLYFSIEIPPGYYSLGCNKTPCLIMKVQQALINRGYNIPLNGKMDKMTRDTLTRFAKDNGLPIPQNGNFLIWFPELSEYGN